MEDESTQVFANSTHGSPNLKRHRTMIGGYGVGIAAFVFCLAIAILVLEPIWAAVPPPFTNHRYSPAIAAPVDGPFYINNAREGYDWQGRDPLSLAFHPLLSVALRALPDWLPSHVWFWVISLLCGFVSLLFAVKITDLLAPVKSNRNLALFTLPAAPGAVAMATGNAETPTLVLCSGLLLVVLSAYPLALTVILSIAAMLTKPNALYLIPMLVVLAGHAIRNKNTHLAQGTIAGALALTMTFMLWALYVGWMSHDLTAYATSRMYFEQYVGGDPVGYIDHMLRAFGHNGSDRDRIRYTSPIVVVFFSVMLICDCRSISRIYKCVALSGIACMTAMFLIQGNPNKVIVYVTTLPLHLPVHVAWVQQELTEARSGHQSKHFIRLISYCVYCLCCVAVIAYGTPFGWYY